MKWIRFGLVSLFVLAMSTAAMADEKTDAKPAAGKSNASAKWNGSPEDMAKSALAKWKDVLKLTPEQQPQFESVMKASYEKMAEDRKDAAGDKAKMKASMESNLNDREAALAKILSPDQMKIYQAKMKEMAGKAKHWNKEAAKTETKTDAKTGEK